MARASKAEEARASATWDVIIVGAGPSGLSAALILGRCRRRILVFDDGQPRNARSRAAHGFFTRDGTPPAELLRIGRTQLKPYGVRVLNETVTRARRVQGHYAIETRSGTTHSARKLLLATGLVDQLPKLPGIEQVYGRSVFHCPYCDGWEVRDRPLAVHGSGHKAVELALALSVFSPDVVLCTDGRTRLSRVDRQELLAHEIALRTERIARLQSRGEQLTAIVFESGERLRRHALFFQAPTLQRSSLVAQLGCTLGPKQFVSTGDQQNADDNGLYVVGDAADDVNYIAVAAAEGVKAACAIHRALRRDETSSRVRAVRARMRAGRPVH